MGAVEHLGGGGPTDGAAEVPERCGGADGAGGPRGPVAEGEGSRREGGAYAAVAHFKCEIICLAF